MVRTVPAAWLIPLVIVSWTMAHAQDLPKYLPARPPEPGAAEELEAVLVPGAGVVSGLAVCGGETVVVRGGRLHRLPRQAAEWKDLGPAPTGTVAIAGNEQELWAIEADGGVTVLDAANGTMLRQVRLPELPFVREGLSIVSLAVTADAVLVSAARVRKDQLPRVESIVRLARGEPDAAWVEVRARGGTYRGIGVDAGTGGAVVAQGDCAMWVDPSGAPTRAAIWSEYAQVFALDGTDGLVLTAKRAPKGEAPEWWLRRLRLAPRPCVIIELVRDAVPAGEGGDVRGSGPLRWVVDGTRCDARSSLNTALDQIAERDEVSIGLLAPGARVIYGDVAETIVELRKRKVPIAIL